MSLVKSKAIQLGFDATPTNNFLIYQPLTPDGTFRIANGNQGATTDIMTVTSGGSVTFAGTTNFSSLNFGSGSASAPSLFPTGDSNTGIWFPAADTLAVSTGGSERIRVDSSGNINLGGYTAAANSLRYLDIQNSDSSSGSGSIVRLITLNSAGTANTTVDIVKYKSGAFIINNNDTSGYIAINNAGSERIRLDSSGKVGIGTNLPTKNLEVYTADTSTTTTSGIKVTNGSSVIDTRAGITFQNYDNNGAAIWSPRTGSTAGYLAFGTNPGTGTIVDTAITERMRIDNSGNVVIGSTTANARLEVSGSSQTGVVYTRISNSFGSLGNNASGTGLQFYGWDAGVTANIKSIRDGQSYSPSSLLFETYGGAGTSGANTLAERMRIDSYGNVSIGYAGAGWGKLHVHAPDGSAAGSEYRGLVVSGTSNAQKVISLSYDNANDYGVLSSVHVGTTWKPVVINPTGGNVYIGPAIDSTYKMNLAWGGNTTSLDSTAGSQMKLAKLYTFSGNNDYLEITNTRTATGSTWYTSGFRIQQKVDSTYMAYIQFNGNGNGGGMSIATGASNVSSSSVTDSFKITGDGVITTPKQPAICVRSMAHNSSANWTGGSVSVNRGGMSYNSTTGVITVPVAGLYEVHAHMLYNTASQGAQMILYYNGSFYDEAFVNTGAGTGTMSGLETASMTILINMAANETLAVKAQAGGWYSNATGNVITVKLVG